jgi:hypothetical protein
VVPARPEEALLAFEHLQPREVNAAITELCHHRLREIVAHHAHQAHLLQENGGRQADVGGRTANGFLGHAERGFDAVECDGAYGDELHGCQVEKKEGRLMRPSLAPRAGLEPATP